LLRRSSRTASRTEPRPPLRQTEAAAIWRPFSCERVVTFRRYWLARPVSWADARLAQKPPSRVQRPFITKTGAPRQLAQKFDSVARIPAPKSAIAVGARVRGNC